jgi:hypothetical protein
MKKFLLPAMTLALLAGGLMSPAMAEGPRTSGGDAWYGMTDANSTTVPAAACGVYDNYCYEPTAPAPQYPPADR